MTDGGPAATTRTRMRLTAADTPAQADPAPQMIPDGPVTITEADPGAIAAKPVQVRKVCVFALDLIVNGGSSARSSARKCPRS